MLVTPASLSALTIEFSMLFKEGRENATPFWKKIASLASSSTTTSKYPYLARVPRMREWVSERAYKGMKVYDYTLENKDYEASIKVSRNAIEDDVYGVYDDPMRALGQAASYWKDDLVVDALNAGESQKCYDGKNFFASDHPVNPDDSSTGTQSNLLTSSPLNTTNYAIARQKMSQFKGEDGKSLRARGNLLVVPPALEYTALQVVNADLTVQTQAVSGTGTAVATNNVLKGSAEILVIPDLPNDTDWFLIDASKPVKPFLLQMRKEPEFVAQDKLDSDSVFDRKEFTYGCDGRGAGGYALWFLAIKCKA